MVSGFAISGSHVTGPFRPPCPLPEGHQGLLAWVQLHPMSSEDLLDATVVSLEPGLTLSLGRRLPAQLPLAEQFVELGTRHGPCLGVLPGPPALASIHARRTKDDSARRRTDGHVVDPRPAPGRGSDLDAGKCVKPLWSCRNAQKGSRAGRECAHEAAPVIDQNGWRGSGACASRVEDDESSFAYGRIDARELNQRWIRGVRGRDRGGHPIDTRGRAAREEQGYKKSRAIVDQCRHPSAGTGWRSKTHTLPRSCVRASIPMPFERP
jgi:hypothetical protein